MLPAGAQLVGFEPQLHKVVSDRLAQFEQHDVILKGVSIVQGCQIIKEILINQTSPSDSDVVASHT